MDKPIDEYLREALFAVQVRGIRIGRVGFFSIYDRDRELEYYRGGYFSERKMTISHGGSRLEIQSSQKRTTVLMDRVGVCIVVEMADLERGAFPTLKFVWDADGDLSVIEAGFFLDQYVQYKRNADGAFVRKDECEGQYLIWYADQLPPEITEGEAVLGQPIRLHIDMRKEINKIIKKIEIKEFIRAVKNYKD